MAGWRSLIALGVCLAAAVQLVASTPITEYVAMAPAGGGGGPDRAATTVSSSATCTKKHTLGLDRNNLMMRVGTVASCSIWHVHGRVAVSGALGALDRVVGSDQKLERCFLVVCLSLLSQVGQAPVVEPHAGSSCLVPLCSPASTRPGHRRAGGDCQVGPAAV